MRDVKESFDALASQYDGQRAVIVPDFDRFYGAAVWAAAWPGERPRILDIGAGTGLLSELLLRKYPRATVTLMDFSQKMLEVARRRFEGRENVRFIEGDYREEDLRGPYDIVASALSIHHLDREEKKQLYGRVYASLDAGGIFINADQVKGESEWLDQRYLEYWQEFLRQGALQQEELKKTIAQRRRLDREEKLSVQLQWLEEGGFTDVGTIYKNRSLSVFMGRKL